MSEPDNAEIPQAEAGGGYYSSPEYQQQASASPSMESNPFAASSIGPSALTTQATIDRGFGYTRFGINLIFYSMIPLALLSILYSCAQIAMPLLAESLGMEVFSAIGIVSFLSGALMVIVGALTFVGKCFCVSVPVVVGGRGLVYTSITLAILAVIGYAIFTVAYYAWFLRSFSPDDITQNMIGLLATQMLYNGLRLASFIAFVWFLRRLATYLDIGWLKHLAMWITCTLIAMCLLLGALYTIATVRSTSYFESSVDPVWVIAQVLLIITSLIVYPAYLVMLFKLARTLSEQAMARRRQQTVHSAIPVA